MNASLDMTPRDWFAGLAMQGLVAGGSLECERDDDVAAMAYNMADAMLAERERSAE